MTTNVPRRCPKAACPLMKHLKPQQAARRELTLLALLLRRAWQLWREERPRRRSLVRRLHVSELKCS